MGDHADESKLLSSSEEEEIGLQDMLIQMQEEMRRTRAREEALMAALSKHLDLQAEKVKHEEDQSRRGTSKPEELLVRSIPDRPTEKVKHEEEQSHVGTSKLEELLAHSIPDRPVEMVKHEEDQSRRGTSKLEELLAHSIHDRQAEKVKHDETQSCRGNSKLEGRAPSSLGNRAQRFTVPQFNDKDSLDLSEASLHVENDFITPPRLDQGHPPFGKERSGPRGRQPCWGYYGTPSMGPGATWIPPYGMPPMHLNAPHLPQLQLQKFDGEIRNYPSFVQEFKAFVEMQCLDDHRRLLYLQMYVVGEPARLIQCCNSYFDKKMAYQKAWELLDGKYAGSIRLLNAVKEDLLKGPQLKVSDADGLSDLSVRMSNCLCLFESRGAVGELNGTELLSRIMKRLPIKLQERFAELSCVRQRVDQSPMFSDLLHIVDDAANYARTEWAQHVFKGKESTASGSGYGLFAKRGRDKIKSLAVKNVPDEESKKKCCESCKGDHALWTCESFKSLAVDKRRSLVKQKSLCFNCLKKGHRASDCSFKRKCSTCGSRHHTLLHIDSIRTARGGKRELEPNAIEKEEEPQDGIRTVATCGNKQKRADSGKCMMNIVPVRVWAEGGEQTAVTYALLDSGSTACLCTPSLVKRLKLEEQDDPVELHGVGSVSKCLKKVGPLYIQGIQEKEALEVSCCRVTSNLPDCTGNIPTAAYAKQFSHLCDINLTQLESRDVSLLIGADAHEAFRLLEQRVGDPGQPFGLHTALGWTLFGSQYECSSDCSAVCCRVTEQLSGEDTPGRLLEVMMYDFLDLDQPQTTEMSRQDKAALAVMQQSLEKEGQHYKMKLPWKDDGWMPNNRVMAEQRLNTLKRRLKRHPEEFRKYCEKMDQYLASGHASLIPRGELLSRNRIWYLPHFATGAKFRVVFDCKAEFEGVSFNKSLLQGPDLNNNLTGVLLRFRQEPVAFVADIRSMFHQVYVDAEDRDAQRFLWWPENDLEQEPAEYRMNVFLFGSTCSPSCAAYALRRTAEDNLTGAGQGAVSTVFSNFYVDDLLKSCASKASAVSLIGELRPLLKSGGFELAKFISNEREVLSCVPECDRADAVVDLSLHELPTERTLGVFWDTEMDVLKVRVNVQRKPLSRRGVLSMLSQIFDVLGLVQPFVLPARKLLQESCSQQGDWDEPLAKHHQEKWEQWLRYLPFLERLGVSRSFRKPGVVSKHVQLHVFCDASLIGYGAVCYIRTVCLDGSISCVFCMGKARVTPLVPVSVPRLELTAAVLAVKLCSFVTRELEVNFDSIVLWTDATIVLQYIANECSRFRTFVANRLQRIHAVTTPEQWRHVPTAQNPADVASRGIMPNKVEAAGLWLKGPAFLLKSENEWPQQTEISAELSNEDAEVKKKRVFNVVEEPGISVLHELLRRHSSYRDIRRSLAWIMRFRAWFLWRCQRGSTPKRGRLSAEDMRCATTELVKLVQHDAFPEAMRRLPNVMDANSTQRLVTDTELCRSPWFQQLRKLTPFLLNGVMRMDGRLRNSDIPEESKHPAILPPEHPVTKLLIMEFHREGGHCGVSQVLNTMQRMYWVIRGRAAVRKVIHSCMNCKVWCAGTGRQRMADLPHARVTAGKPPFHATGCDLMGPLSIKIGRSEVKRYVVVFTCMASRAVHLEIAQSLEASSFIQAFRRFSARRGKPKWMFSDNATNFKGAERELNEGVRAWNNQRVQDELVQAEIQWAYNTPACSHAGGVWERIIRSVRRCMRLAVNEAVLDEFGLATLIVEIERILNDRPITGVSTDPKDFTALTPNMLLTGTLDTATAPGVFMKRDEYRKSWQQSQVLADRFWQRWISEYLPLLQPRAKWYGSTPNLEPGDLVLIVDDTVRRGCWPKAIVEECYPDRHGLVRRVRVRTATAVLTRDVRKICLLEGHLVDMDCAN